LKKIHWQDQEGKQRLWEAAERKTRGSSGVDGQPVSPYSWISSYTELHRCLAVSIITIIRSKTNAFPPSTVILEQYRPPMANTIIELPAGTLTNNLTYQRMLTIITRTY
jgi:ADP-ribose pyrophosphatase